MPAVVPFGEMCARLDAVLSGSFRRDVVASLPLEKPMAQALVPLAHGMRAHVWRGAATRIDLSAVDAYDVRTRSDGFHAMHDWDGIADHVNADSIPLDVLNFLATQRGRAVCDPIVPAVLLDYYLLHVLGLLSLRIWDAGDADDNLERLGHLLEVLQGEHGSGQPFVSNAETLMLVATSHYERDERGYETLLAKVRTLDRAHREAIALGHAASLGCHLRFGFEATYGRDLAAMRDDNTTDYPWLRFSVATLLEAYARARQGDDTSPGRDDVIEALLNALTPDAIALTATAPAATDNEDAQRIHQVWAEHGASLREEFTRYRPTGDDYSPLCLYFNFSHNVLKGIVIDTLLRGDVWPVTLNDLLSGRKDRGPSLTSRASLARTLMAYAEAYPHRIRGRLTPVIVYDVPAGKRACAAALRALGTA